MMLNSERRLKRSDEREGRPGSPCSMSFKKPLMLNLMSSEPEGGHPQARVGRQKVDVKSFEIQKIKRQDPVLGK